MVVLLSTGAPRYHNCCIDGGTSPEYFGYLRVQCSHPWLADFVHRTRKIKEKNLTIILTSEYCVPSTLHLSQFSKI
jgi:hypothetical protein